MRYLLMMATLMGGVCGQVITAPVGPLIPGTTVSIGVLNNTANQSFCANSGMLAMIHAEGELAAPRVPATTDACISHGPGVTWQYGLSIPATGPGSNGSFVLLAIQGPGAVARIDVGAPSIAFPAIHSFPIGIAYPVVGHAFSQSPTAWTFANVSAAAFVFGPGAVLEVQGLDRTVLGQTPLAGLTLAPNTLLRMALPLAGLAPAPYLVEARWTDPVAGSVIRRFGIRDNAGADLGLPEGKVIPLAGNIEVRMNGRSPVSAFPPTQHLYALAIGLSPGFIPLPNGTLLPLANEPIVWASLTPGGLPPISANLGTAATFGFPLTNLRADNILLGHPGPALSGLEIRIAGLFSEPNTGYLAPTQAEIITLQ